MITPEQLAKLPKWAQAEFETLLRQREVAVRELREWTDSQTPSKIRIKELVCLNPGAPSSIVRYIQAHCIEFEHEGVVVEVTVPYYNKQAKYIEIRWGAVGGSLSDEVACVPQAFQSVKIVGKENLR